MSGKLGLHHRPFLGNRAASAALSRSTVPVVGIPGVAFDTMAKGVAPVERRLALMRLADFMHGPPLRTHGEICRREAVDRFDHGREILFGHRPPPEIAPLAETLLQMRLFERNAELRIEPLTAPGDREAGPLVKSDGAAIGSAGVDFCNPEAMSGNAFSEIANQGRTDATALSGGIDPDARNGIGLVFPGAPADHPALTFGNGDVTFRLCRVGEESLASSLDHDGIVETGFPCSAGFPRGKANRADHLMIGPAIILIASPLTTTLRA